MRRIPSQIKEEIKELFSKSTTKNCENNWEKTVDFLFLVELTMSKLKNQKAITVREEREVREKIKSLSYWACINAPRAKNNKKIKKEIELLFLNSFLDDVGLGKQVRCIDGEDTA